MVKSVGLGMSPLAASSSNSSAHVPRMLNEVPESLLAVLFISFVASGGGGVARIRIAILLVTFVTSFASQKTFASI